MIYVSPGQVNFEVPSGHAPGPAAFALTNATTTQTFTATVQPVAPALFAMNGTRSGVAAATAIPVRRTLPFLPGMQYMPGSPAIRIRNPESGISSAMSLRILPATERNVPVVLEMIRGLADYEKLAHLVTATEERIRATLFGESPAAEVLLAYRGEDCVGFAVFFRSYSTFLAEPGIYLEDLYVKPEARGHGVGFALLGRVARIAVERGSGRVEWEVLDWNEPSIGFYRRLGAVPLDAWTKYRLTGEALSKLAGESSGL